ncbi:outer membrane beta-barrel protein [Pedobacter sp. Hv1]|uniref:outer membrane beta-barrel protein n=1 Tax=Pedobacter sp. Hv1 TaxID=1740090 RepID=UPI0006D8C51D|nr:outer membrane beta-barrel protein [Pedobacter sp. Hv1]KQC02319.1 hypothetical protein AQF98_01705 [Pedobacter sp. Hv1]
MKKLLLSFAIVVGLGLAANAQTEGPVHKISIGPDFIYPFGLAADSYNIGYGGSVMGEYNIAKKLNLTASVGFTMLSYKKEVKALFTDLKNDVYYPIKLGAKYYFGPVYAGADAGIGLSLKDNRNSSFAFSGTVGKTFSVSPKSSVDVGIRYEGWSMYREQEGVTLIDNYSFAGIRLAYAFGL